MSRALELTGLIKRYGRHTALDGFSARWDEGKTVALIGANGGGKSTLLKMLAGVLTPDGGQLGGLVAFRVAYMPDRLAFGRGWTALSWLNLVASWKKAPRARVDAVLEEAGLLAVGRQSIATFSQGMLRRLLYAQTRLTEADLVLLDEPEGGLDPQWVLRLEDELDRLRAAGTTVVFSTHWLDLAVERADELAVISGGRLVVREASALWKPLGAEERRRRLVELIGPLP